MLALLWHNTVNPHHGHAPFKVLDDKVCCRFASGTRLCLHARTRAHGPIDVSALIGDICVYSVSVITPPGP